MQEFLCALMIAGKFHGFTPNLLYNSDDFCSVPLSSGK